MTLKTDYIRDKLKAFEYAKPERLTVQVELSPGVTTELVHTSHLQAHATIYERNYNHDFVHIKDPDLRITGYKFE